jgi:hypothetical protein
MRVMRAALRRMTISGTMTIDVRQAAVGARAHAAHGRRRRGRGHGHRCCVAVVGVVLGAGLATGCGSGDEGAGAAAATPSQTVDDARVEQGIKDSLSTSAVEVTSVKCPTDVAAKTGATFTCAVTFSNGAAGKATVKQAGSGQYAYEVKPGSVQVPGATADAAVEKSLAAQGFANATVNCPANIIVKVETTITCDVSGAQGAASGSVTYTFSEANGTVDPSSVTAS